MGLHLENDEDAGKVLEKMMNKFDIDLSDVINDEENNSEISKRRKDKKEK